MYIYKDQLNMSYVTLSCMHIIIKITVVSVATYQLRMANIKREVENRETLCRDGVDTQYVFAIIKQKPYNLTTNMLKAYLSTKASSLSAFMISKTHRVAQKPRRG